MVKRPLYVSAGRDTQLDAYRALVMIYILCVIHVMYWLGQGTEPYKSVLLIEMPVIFFISGAALSLKPKRQFNLWKTFVNRFRRVMFPYYLYAAASIMLVCAICLYSEGWPISFTFGLQELCSVLLGRSLPSVPYAWHLWFILPYMVLSCLFPIHERLLNHISAVPYVVVNALLFILAQQYLDQELILHVLCYNLFMLLGYCFYRKLSFKVLHVLGALSLVCLVFLWYRGEVIPMQSHKFPPDIIFALWGASALGVLSCIFHYVKLPICNFLMLWDKRGYTIYLYQNWVFVCVPIFLRLIPEGFLPPPPPHTHNRLVHGFLSLRYAVVHAVELSYLSRRACSC